MSAVTAFAAYANGLTVAAPARSLDSTELRRQRGLAIAAVCNIRAEGRDNRYRVPSQTGNGHYLVSIDRKQGPDWRCDCKDFEKRGEACKHVFAVKAFMEREKVTSDPATIPLTSEPTKLAKRLSVEAKTEIAERTTPERPTYKQNWPAYNAAQIHEKDKFQELLADLCRGIPEPPRPHGGTKGGRLPVPMADRVFAMVLKVYTAMSGRRASTDMRDAKGKGHLSHDPSYSRVARFLEDPAMTQILASLIAESAKPLRAVEVDFVVDSTGFATSRFVRWFDHKYGIVKKQYDWVKVSAMCGVKTNVITAVEIDERYSADCPKFAPLVNATAENGFTLGEVSADKAYLSYENMEVVASHGGTPFIMFKANTAANHGGTLARMFHLYNFNRDDYLTHYHKRSNVESTFSMMKAKFGDSLRSKTDTAMVNEALCKVLCHNVCCLIQSIYELGIVAAFWGEEPDTIATHEIEPGESTMELWDWV